MLRPHIHRYTLRIKIITSKSEGDEQILIQKTLQNFFDIVLQGDPKSIIPPYFDLDRSDKSVPDLCSTFNVAALDSYYSLKRYFSRLFPRSKDGFVWCSIILAQSVSFASFMEKKQTLWCKYNRMMWMHLIKLLIKLILRAKKLTSWYKIIKVNYWQSAEVL